VPRGDPEQPGDVRHEPDGLGYATDLGPDIGGNSSADGTGIRAARESPARDTAMALPARVGPLARRFR
jgi:hypothetical protein